MTINLQDIASIVTIIAMGSCAVMCITTMIKSRKNDKQMDTMLAELDKEHRDFFADIFKDRKPKAGLKIVDSEKDKT